MESVDRLRTVPEFLPCQPAIVLLLTLKLTAESVSDKWRWGLGAYDLASVASACPIPLDLADLPPLGAGLGTTQEKSKGEGGDEGKLHGVCVRYCSFR